MIGCILLTFGGALLAARMVHRFHGRGLGCGSGPWGYPCGRRGFGHHGHGLWRHRGRWHGFDGPSGEGDEAARFDQWHPAANDGPPWELGSPPLGRRGAALWVRCLCNRLEASPAQQVTIREAADELRRSLAKHKDLWRNTRSDVAAAFRKSTFDEVAIGELFGRHDAAIEDARKAFVGFAARIHDVLDDEQRKRLADIAAAAA